MNYITALKFARKNRRNPTRAESIFWNNVRSKKLFRLKINRQFIFEYRLAPLGPKRYFITDFYCHQLNLVIEIDGEIHDYQKEYDLYREQILQGLGLRVIRFTNIDIQQNWQKVENTIGKLLI